jgi:hypothetical protein
MVLKPNRTSPIDTAIIAWRCWAKNPHGQWRESAERITSQRYTRIAYVMAEYVDIAIPEVLKGQRSDLRLDSERARLHTALKAYGQSGCARVGVNVLNAIASHV